MLQLFDKKCFLSQKNSKYMDIFWTAFFFPQKKLKISKKTPTHPTKTSPLFPMSVLQAAHPSELFTPRAAIRVPLGSLWAREHQGSGRAGLIPLPQPQTLDTSLRTGHGVSSWGLAGHGQVGARLHRKWLPRAGVSAGHSLPAALQQDGVAPGRTSAPVLAAGPQEGHAPRALAQGTGKCCSFARVQQLVYP